MTNPLPSMEQANRTRPSVEPSAAVRVLLCLTSLDRTGGGIASVNRNVLRALQGRTADGGAIEIDAVLYHDDAVESTDGYLAPASVFRAAGCRSSKWRFVARLFWRLLCRRPQLVFVDHLHLAVVVYLFRRLLPNGYVLFCHGVEFDKDVTAARERAFRAARLRLSNSRFTAQRLSDRFAGVTVEPAELGLDDLALPDNAEPVTELPDATGRSRPLGSRVILIVARLSATEQYKGHDQLIEVMDQLITTIPGAQLVIVGSGDDLDRLRAKAMSGRANEAILFAGFVSGPVLARLFSQCRLYAMPSRGEGFGLVYLEAMRYAKPCLASRVDAGREVVEDNVTGLLVDPDDRAAMSGALERLLCDDLLARRLGDAGFDRLQNRYRFEHFRSRLRSRLARLVPSLAEDEPDRA